MVAAAALALASCGAAEDKAGAAPAETSAETGQITLDSTASLQDWLMLARTSDGGYVHFNQRSIFREPGGDASIQVQIRYGQPQLFRTETEASETTVRYTVERVTYHFQCGEGAFYPGERQIIGEGDVVQATIPTASEIYRPVRARGIAALIMPVACRGS